MGRDACWLAFLTWAAFAFGLLSGAFLPREAAATDRPPSLVPSVRTLAMYFAEGGEANELPSRLTANRPYRFVVDVGPSMREAPHEFAARLTEAGVPVRIVMRCEFCVSKQRQQATALRLQQDQQTEARFEVTPAQVGESRLVVTVERDHQIVRTVIVPVEVVSRKPRARRERLRLVEAMVSSLAFAERRLAVMQSGALDVGPGPQVLAVPLINALRADLVIEVDVGSARITMKGPVVGAALGAPTEMVMGDALATADLQSLLADTYNRLYAVARQKSVRLQYADTSDGPLGYVSLKEVTIQEILFEFARTGNAMYVTLFARSPRLLKVLKKLRQIPGTPRVYVKTAGAFLPWALVYDAPRETLKKPESVDRNGFWGSRYVIAGVPMLVESEPTTRVLGQARPRIVAGYYAGEESPFPIYRENQREFLARFEVAETFNEDKFLDKLAELSGAADFVYVFAHGKGGAQTIRARIVDSDRVIEFLRPNPADASIRLSPLSLQRTGLRPKDILLLNINEQHLAQPLVFLNVCEGAATAEISQSNFVTAFFNVGAGAVIATDMQMLQALAAHFARSFLSEIQEAAAHTSLSEIMLRLRQRYVGINPLVYAYTLWGDGVVVGRR